MINLTEEERRKFTAWCRQEAESYELIVAAMDKGPNYMVSVADANRRKMLALRIVAQHVESIEDLAVGGRSNTVQNP